MSESEAGRILRAFLNDADLGKERGALNRALWREGTRGRCIPFFARFGKEDVISLFGETGRLKNGLPPTPAGSCFGHTRRNRPVRTMMDAGAESSLSAEQPLNFFRGRLRCRMDGKRPDAAFLRRKRMERSGVIASGAGAFSSDYQEAETKEKKK